MIAKTYSISGLSVELGIDRRSLARQLEGLTPKSEKVVGNRTERQYTMADVVTHIFGRASDGEVYDYAVERARLTKAQADKTELEVKEIRGEVVRMPLVEQHWGGMVASMRARLLALPSKVAAMVATPDKLQQVTDITQTLVYEALSEIAGDAIPDDVRRRAEACTSELNEASDG